MVYADIQFQGRYIFAERARLEKQALIAASFTAYQILQAKVKDLPKWSAYCKQLGLIEETSISKDDLKREAAQAMANAQKAISELGGDIGGR